MQNKRSLGTEKEELAVAYLTEQKAEILARNFYFHGGEIDLMAKDGEYVCFIEVKYRKSTRFGAPEEAVDFRKQKKIIAAAQYYLYKNRIPFDTPCRFDVAGVQGNEIRITENAFWM